MEVTHEHGERLVDELMALDERARVARILAMVETALDENAPALPIVVGNILRDRDQFDWAEYVYRIALKVPGARHMALFELSVWASMTGRPQESAALLAEHEAELPLSAYQQRAYAHQLGRLGRIPEASERLDAAWRLEPGSWRECVAMRQFFDYLHRFPYEEARARCQALTESFAFLGVAEVVAEINAALRDRRGWSLIRLNDGEGSIIHLSVEDEARYSELYTRNRREFHHWWYGNDRRVFDPDFLAFTRDFNAAIVNADCWAGFVINHLPVRYERGDVRNIPCLFNIVRKLEQIRDTRPERVGKGTLADPVIHQFLLFDGELEKLLQAQERIGLVSCHAALPGALQGKFGLSEVLFHKTPGEAAITQGAEPEPFPAWHHRISQELEGARRGVLYLVAAGIFSKVYCDIIRRAGGVALDVGSVADIWMKAPTRSFWQAAQDHVLTPT